MKRIGALLIVLGLLLYWFIGRTPTTQPKAPSTNSAIKNKIKAKLPSRSVAPPTNDSEFEADPPGTLRIEGQTVDEEGNAIPNAELAISSNPDRFTTSDANGWFFFDGLLSRSYYIEAHKDGMHGANSVEVNEESLPVVVTLKKGSELAITVLDANNRTPIAGAQLSSGWQFKSRAVTNAEGKALLSCTSRNWCVFMAEASGYATAQEYTSIPSEQTTPFNKEVLLSPGAGVSGVVLGPGDLPVSGATINASAVSGYSDLWWMNDDEYKIVSDEQGRWNIPSFSPGTFRFMANHKKFAAGRSEPVTLHATTPTTDVVIRLQEGETLAGKVVNAKGEPVSSARVRAQQDDNDAESKSVYSDPLGNFSIEGLPKGSILAFAKREDSASEIVPFDLSNGPITGATLTLSVTGTITGIVVLSDGTPIEGVQIQARPKNYNEQRNTWRLRGSPFAQTDLDGLFTLKGLTDGEEFILDAYKDNLDAPPGWEEDKAIKAKTGDTNIRIVMTSRGTFTGTLLYEDGTAPKGAEVYSMNATGRSKIADDGAFSVSGVSAGENHLRASGDFISRSFGPFEGKPGETIDVGILRVKRGREITGKVILADGTGVSGAKIYIDTDFRGSGNQLDDKPDALSGADGSFTLKGRSDKDPLYAVAEHPEKGRSQITMLAKGSDKATVTLILEETGALEGIVTYKGKPLKGHVQLTPETLTYGGRISVESDEEGFYRFDTLAPGKYLLTAERKAYWPEALSGGTRTINVTLASKKTTTANIEVPGGVALTFVVTQNGTTPKSMSLYLIKGDHQASNSLEMTTFMRPLQEDQVQSVSAYEGSTQKIKIEDVTAGSYTLCIQIFLPEDEAALFDPEKEPEPTPVDCSPLTVAANPSEQTVIRAVR